MLQDALFSNKKRQQALENRKYLAASLAFVGLLLLSHDLRLAGSESIFNFLDETFFFILGLGLFLSAHRKLKRIKGSFVEFAGNTVGFQSRKVERRHIPFEQITLLEITGKIIVFDTHRQKGLTIFLEDYPENERKEILDRFGASCVSRKLTN